ncbi:MAG: NADPH-dependent F420 reductase [Chloroflexi bacterium]|nr:NADPH-dependent F420 reductase [Chloroflexota bacterium]
MGGTGKEGSGLAYRWARAGYDIIIGSRRKEKAEATAAELNSMLDKERVTGMENSDAAGAGDVIVLTVPFSAHRNTLETIHDEVQGKIFIDVTVPLRPPNVNVVQLPEEGSAAQITQELLGKDVLVVSAFQNVSATHLKDDEHEVDCDVLVTGDDEGAKKLTLKLIEAIGMRGIDAGPLANAAIAEGLTSVLIHINKQYRIKNSGIRITGID